MPNKCKNPECDNKFNPSNFHPNQKYCSDKCQRRHYYLKNKERENRESKKWYKNNKEYKRKKSLEWYYNHKEYSHKKNKEYRKENKEFFKNYRDEKRFDGMRKKILKRDKYRCRICGAEVGDVTKNELSVHHIDGSGWGKEGNTNNDLNNLITLCNSCHHKLHWWQRKNSKRLKNIEEIVKILEN